MSEVRPAWRTNDNYDCPWCGRRLGFRRLGDNLWYIRGYRLDGDHFVYRQPRHSTVKDPMARGGGITSPPVVVECRHCREAVAIGSG